MVGSTAYILVGFFTASIGIKLVSVAFGFACTALIIARLSLTQHTSSGDDSQSLGNRELVLRMATAATLVFSLTAFARALGPLASGLIAGFPIYSSVLAAFNHVKSARLAVSTLRGVVTGAFGAAVFFVIVGSMLGRLSTGVCFVVATAAAVGTQAILLPTLR